MARGIRWKDYESKVESILSDTGKFKKVDGDPFKIILGIETKINTYLRKHTKGNTGSILHDSTYKEIYASGTSPGILYGLPKVHKKDCPVRPILSACNTPAYNLAKFLVPVLNPITRNEYFICKRDY